MNGPALPVAVILEAHQDACSPSIERASQHQRQARTKDDLRSSRRPPGRLPLRSGESRRDGSFEFDAPPGVHGRFHRGQWRSPPGDRRHRARRYTSGLEGRQRIPSQAIRTMFVMTANPYLAGLAATPTGGSWASLRARARPRSAGVSSRARVLNHWRAIGDDRRLPSRSQRRRPLPSRSQRAGAFMTRLIGYTARRFLAAGKSVLPPTFWADPPETGGRRCPNVRNCPEPLDVQDVCPYDSSTMSCCPQIGGAV